jgi:hypothetical protein
MEVNQRQVLAAWWIVQHLQVDSVGREWMIYVMSLLAGTLSLDAGMNAPQ